MTLNELIQKAAEGYPDAYLLNYWDAEKHCFNEDGSGDTLAEFIVRELIDTFEENASDGEQIAEAIRVLESARAELNDVVHVLENA